MTKISFTPARFNAAASSNTLPTGRDTKSPRMLGIIQKVQRWLQPSDIFK
ncbi:Uncharacterised protein [Acinetobacter baumannii]|nr:Uncharacterised protein [Acinetobacter baumannii]